MRRWLVGWVLWSGGCIEMNPMFVDPTVGDEAGETTSAPPATDSAATTEPPDTTSPASTTTGPTSPTTGPTSEPTGPTSEPTGPTSEPTGPTSETMGPTSETMGPTSETMGSDTEGTMGPTTESSSTSEPMPGPECGDGAVEGDEECDDADRDQNDDCIDCMQAKCGDGFVQYEDYKDKAEQCDDGNVIDNDGCMGNCMWPVCGDGEQDIYEECDDGNMENGDGCEFDCTMTERIIFVTSMLYSGAMGGLAGADFKCNILADKAMLPGVYMAWLSTETESPSTRMSQLPFPYVRSDGSMIAPDWETLVNGPLMGPIALTEHQQMPPDNPTVHVCGPTRVHTNTLASGVPFSKDADCAGWTGENGNTLSGSFAESDEKWSDLCPVSLCKHPTPIYCVQQ